MAAGLAPGSRKEEKAQRRLGPAGGGLGTHMRVPTLLLHLHVL